MADFKPVYILKILHIIYYQLSVDSLLDLGLEYSQIIKLLSYVIQERYVSDSEEGLILTSDGLEIIKKLNKELYTSNPQAWILPLDENRIPKIDKFDIYLPKKRKFEE
jgi:hypothetical protein